MEQAKPGEVRTDGKSVVIGAPVARASGGPPRTPSEAMQNVLRHLKGVVASTEELQRLMERQEKKEESR